MQQIIGISRCKVSKLRRGFKSIHILLFFFLFAINHAWGHNILQCRTKMLFAIYHAWMLVDIKRFRPLLDAFSSNFSTLTDTRASLSSLTVRVPFYLTNQDSCAMN